MDKQSPEQRAADRTLARRTLSGMGVAGYEATDMRRAELELNGGHPAGRLANDVANFFPEGVDLGRANQAELYDNIVRNSVVSTKAEHGTSIVLANDLRVHAGAQGHKTFADRLEQQASANYEGDFEELSQVLSQHGVEGLSSQTMYLVTVMDDGRIADSLGWQVGEVPDPEHGPSSAARQGKARAQVADALRAEGSAMTRADLQGGVAQAMGHRAGLLRDEAAYSDVDHVSGDFENLEPEADNGFEMGL